MENYNGYRVIAAWKGGRMGTASAEQIEPQISFSSPPEFKGEAGYWTPEHFLVAAVSSCFVVTFYAIAELSKLEFLALELSAVGKLGKPEGKLRFVEMVLSPTVTIARNEDRERANRLLEKAEQGCLIARSLAFPVTMEPVVQVAEGVLAR